LQISLRTFLANIGGVGLSKESDVVTVAWKEMDDGGVFTCPKCKRLIDPDLPDEWEMLGYISTVVLLIKHLCGQKIRIDMSGFVEGVAK